MSRKRHGRGWARAGILLLGSFAAAPLAAQAPGAGIAVMKIPANRVTSDVLSVGGNARATEYTLRHHVEFEVRDDAGAVLMPMQVIELTREFTFDASQALGVASETDLLTKELERDMVQAIMRRLEAIGGTLP